MSEQRIIPIKGKDVLCELVKVSPDPNEDLLCKRCAAYVVGGVCLAPATCDTDTIWRPVGEKPPVAPDWDDAIIERVTELERTLREATNRLETIAETNPDIDMGDLPRWKAVLEGKAGKSG